MIRYFCVMVLLAIGTSDLLASGGGSADGQENMLPHFISRIIGDPDVQVEMTGDSVVFRGSDEKVAAAITKLRQFSEIRSHLQPIASGQLAHEAHDPVSSWAALLGLLVQDPSQFNIVNLGVTGFVDENHRLRGEGLPALHIDVLQVYLNNLAKLSPLFAWARKTIPDFVQVTDSSISVNYGMLVPYMFLEAAEVVDGAASVGSVNLMQTFVGAVQGRVALDGGRLYYLGIGDAAHRTPVLEIACDVSGSMMANLDTVSASVMAMLNQLQASLELGHKLRVVVSAFDEIRYDVAKYNFEGGNHVDIAPIRFGGGGETDLTLIAQAAHTTPDTPKTLVCYTDGNHTTGGDLNASLRQMGDSIKEGSSAHLNLVKFGVVSDFFQSAARITGGKYRTVADVAGLTSELAERVRDGYTPKIAVTVEGTQIAVRWIPDLVGVYYAGEVQDDTTAVSVAGHRVDMQSASQVDLRDAEIAALRARLAVLEGMQ